MPTEPSEPLTTTLFYKVGSLLLLLLIVLLFTACSTVSPVSPPLVQPIPQVLRTTESEPSASFSERVRLWLLKAQATLTSFEAAPKP